MRYMSSFLLALKNLIEMICVLITIQRGNKDCQGENYYTFISQTEEIRV